MKKVLLSIMLVLVMAIPAFAQVDIDGPKTTGSLSPITGANMQQGQSLINANSFTPTSINTNNNANFNNNENRNTNTNLNTNINNNENRNTNVQGQNQDQSQGQLQGQGQGQSQFGYVNIETPQALLGAPSQSVPEINFGHGKIDWNFARSLPKLPIPTYSPGETVVKVVDTKANIKAKKYLSTGLSMIEEQKPLHTNDRLIVIKAEAQKTWTSGGNIGGAGSYLPTSGLAGASGAGSIVPSWGGTKADDLYTVIIVRVAW